MNKDKKIIEMQTKIKNLKKEVIMYKKAFDLLDSYFDSISDEEQPKVFNKFKRLGIYEKITF